VPFGSALLRTQMLEKHFVGLKHLLSHVVVAGLSRSPRFASVSQTSGVAWTSPGDDVVCVSDDRDLPMVDRVPKRIEAVQIAHFGEGPFARPILNWYDVLGKTEECDTA